MGVISPHLIIGRLTSQITKNLRFPLKLIVALE